MKTEISELFIILLFASVFTVIPVAKASPTEFEQYGPHVDQILIKLYANEHQEFQAFEAGEIDVVDWPLTKYWIDRWTGNPEIDMMDYRGEIGAFEFDLNLNETMRAAGPTGAIDGTSELSICASIPEFRHALQHLVDRAFIVSTVMEGFAVPLYGMIPPALGGYVNPSIVEMHPYNPTEAASILAASGIVDSDSNGYLNWPTGMMGGADIELDFLVRDDHSPGTKEGGDRLIWELTWNLPGAKFKVNRWSAIGAVGARKWWMDGKCVDIYTGSWSLSRDPDYLFSLYHSSMYWHPGRPPNAGHVHDSELDGYLEGVYYAQNFADAKTNCWEAQRVMAEKSLVIGMYANSAPEAHRVHYTGGTNGAPESPDDGENMYRGDSWVGFVNEFGSGFNSRWSFYNAHPEGHELAASSSNPMIVRYGFKVAEVNSLNPVYGEWVWDWEIMSKTYDSLIAANPYDLSEDLEWMAKRWEIFDWDNAGSPATELVFELRNDVYFHDGTQLTAQDIYFNFVELVQATEARSLPYPWYYSNLLDVNSVIIENNFKVRVRMNSLSVFAFHWIGENIILPRHVWGPIMMGPDMVIGTPDDDTYDPETFAPDPGLIGSGPFKVYPHSIDKFDYYVPNAYAKMDAWTGHFNNHPIRVSMAVHGSYVDAYVQNFDDMAIMVTATATANGAPLTGGGTVSVPAMPGVGNLPGVAIVHFDCSGLSQAMYDIIVTVSYTFGGQPISDTFTSRFLAPSVTGDINNDNGMCDVWDLIRFSRHFGLKAHVWPEDDIYTDNVINVADASVLISSMQGTLGFPSPTEPGPTTLYLDPVMNGPSDFNVNVMTADVTDLYGYEFKVRFDPNVLAATGTSIGDFFSTPPGYVVWKNEIGSDYVWLVVTRPLGAKTGTSGSGRLATISFVAIGTGSNYLDLTDTGLGNAPGSSINHVALDGYFSNVQTTFLADIVKRKSTNKAEHRTFKISQHGTIQTLYGEIENRGNVPVLARVRFEAYDQAGLPAPGGIMYSATVLLLPAQSMVLTTSMTINSSMKGKWQITNRCQFDSNGDSTLDALGNNSISYDFTVRA